jgi:hypothetical protein
MSSSLLSGEGAVGSYGDLVKRGRRGDNLTPHHIPSNAFMLFKVPGYTKDKGIAIMMEHYSPGVGGRHRLTLSYGQSPDLSISPRQALAREVWDVRSIYYNQGLYTLQMKNGLRLIIEQNKSLWGTIFNK